MMYFRTAKQFATWFFRKNPQTNITYLLYHIDRQVFL